MKEKKPNESKEEEMLLAILTRERPFFQIIRNNE